MTIFSLRRIAFVAIAMTSLACASGGGATNSSASDPAVKRDRNVITADDFRDLTVTSVRDVIQRIHPEWLTPRNAPGGSSTRSRTSTAGSSTEVAVQVYIDLQHAGNADILAQLSPNLVASIRYFSASEAQAKFGNGNIYGAIQIISAPNR